MRRIFILLNLLVITINLFSQLEKRMVLDSMYTYIWDMYSSDWEKYLRHINVHNTSGKKIECTEYEWSSETDNWFFREVNCMDSCYGGRSVYSYDKNDQLTGVIIYDWNSENNEWLWTTRYDLMYDLDENQIEQSRYFWDNINNVWEQNYRHSIEYISNEHQIEKFSYNWNSVVNDWIPSERITTTYDHNGNELENIIYYWHAMTNTWNQSKRFVNTIDNVDNRVKQLTYNWNSTSGEWESISSDIFSYNINGNLTYHSVSSWDPENNKWVEISREVLAYHAFWNHGEKVTYRLDSITNDWINYMKCDAYWSEASSVSNKGDSPDFLMYPHPAKDVLFIETMSCEQYILEVTTLHGQLLFSTSVNGCLHQLDLSSFHMGVYLIILRSENHVKAKRLVRL